MSHKIWFPIFYEFTIRDKEKDSSSISRLDVRGCGSPEYSGTLLDDCQGCGLQILAIDEARLKLKQDATPNVWNRTTRCLLLKKDPSVKISTNVCNNAYNIHITCSRPDRLVLRIKAQFKVYIFFKRKTLQFGDK